MKKKTLATILLSGILTTGCAAPMVRFSDSKLEAIPINLIPCKRYLEIKVDNKIEIDNEEYIWMIFDESIDPPQRTPTKQEIEKYKLNEKDPEPYFRYYQRKNKKQKQKLIG